MVIELYKIRKSMIKYQKLRINPVRHIQLLDHLIMGHNQWVSMKTLNIAFAD